MSRKGKEIVNNRPWCESTYSVQRVVDEIKLDSGFTASEIGGKLGILKNTVNIVLRHMKCTEHRLGANLKPVGWKLIHKPNGMGDEKCKSCYYTNEGNCSCLIRDPRLK